MEQMSTKFVRNLSEFVRICPKFELWQGSSIIGFASVSYFQKTWYITYTSDMRICTVLSLLRYSIHMSGVYRCMGKFYLALLKINFLGLKKTSIFSVISKELFKRLWFFFEPNFILPPHYSRSIANEHIAATWYLNELYYTSTNTVCNMSKYSIYSRTNVD